MKRCIEPGQVLQACAAAFLAGDADAIADLYEDDAIFVAPEGRVICGRVAIRAFYADTLQTFDVAEFQPGTRAETVLGDYAFATSTSLLKLRRRDAGGEVTTMAGFETEILYRGADGGWRYQIDHASALPPASP